jgi:methylglutaconyl-CoA hydratase|tara:strand:+ start:144 stop:932 length:789 start_codon:yes stop_codon:yes gene_type:complete
MQYLNLEKDDRGIARLTLNRPEVHNAFDDQLIAELDSALKDLSGEPTVRVLLLSGAGRSFSAGGDLNWMRRAADYSYEENRADADQLAVMMTALDRFPRPTIAVVNGAAFGGGVGLVAACDIAVASERAVFSLSEVRLGLIPAVISPFVVNAIGQRAARRYFLSGERFDAFTAHRVGLVHEVVPHDELPQRIDTLLDQLLAGGPSAQLTAKELLFRLRRGQDDEDPAVWTAQLIADVRATEEAHEGIDAFLNKRKPAWTADI